MTALPNAFASYPQDDASPAVDPSTAVDRLNSLLRGEISAAETYGGVLDRLTAEDGTGGPVESLTAMRAEHGRSADLLRDRIDALGGEPAESSGLWGVWAQTVQGALMLFGGDVGGLRALHEGEEHGLADYQAALNEVDQVSAQLIQDRLIPAQERHLETLAALLA